MVTRFKIICLLALYQPHFLLGALNKTKNRDIHIGIIDKDGKFKDVFDFALEFVESSNTILPNTNMVALYRTIDSKPLNIITTVLELLQMGVSAIICNTPSYITEQVANYANQMRVPVITPTATDPMLKNHEARPYLLRISPSDTQQSAAISDILTHYNWRHFSILTSFDQYGIHGVAGLQRAATSFNWNIKTIQHFIVPENVSTLDVSGELELLRRSESRIIVLNCEASAAAQVLKQANQYGLAGFGYAWIVTDGVAGKFHDMSPNKVFSPYLDGLLGTIATTKDGALYRWFNDAYSERFDIRRRDIQPFSRLAFDSVLVVSTALHNYFQEGRSLSEFKIDALQEQPVVSEYGHTLYEFLKEVKVNGTTKYLSFAEDGDVEHVKYEILNFDADNGYFKEVGNWLPETGVKIQDEVYFSGGTRVTPSAFIENLQGRHLVLGIDVDAPFIVHEEGCGNDTSCYSGYCVALVKELSHMLGFTYEFVTPLDGTWGGLDPDGETWTGIFKDLIDGRIDIASVHMSINSIREKSIDFSVPFMQAGLTVVVKGKEETNNGYFFLSPFTKDVLYAIGAAVLAVIVIVWIYSRISPNGLYWSKQFARMSCKCSVCRKRRRHEKRENHKHETCDVKELESTEELLARLNLVNTSWIVFASLLNQDPVENWPTSLPGRIVLLFWWLVVMVILAMYTANLAAFLTITKMTTGLTKIEDLLNQDYYSWGTVKDTHPEVALANSVREDLKDIIRKQTAVSTTDEGFSRALEQNYAFIYETPIFEYMKRKHCSLESVGSGDFLSFDYAFGFPTDSPYIDVINRALLELQENSKLDTLWTAILQKIGHCSENQPTAQLALGSLNGVFTCLAWGLIASMVALVGEYIYVSWKDVYGNKRDCSSNQRPKTFLEALNRRLRYLACDIRHSFKCNTNNKHKNADTSALSSEDSSNIDQNHPNKYKKVANGASHSDTVQSDSPDDTGKILNIMANGADNEICNQVREECPQCGHLVNSKATFIP